MKAFLFVGVFRKNITNVELVANLATTFDLGHAVTGQHGRVRHVALVEFDQATKSRKALAHDFGDGLFFGLRHQGPEKRSSRVAGWPAACSRNPCARRDGVFCVGFF